MSVNLHFEEKARAAGFSAVCGVDEAGAGPLMGPVYAAAVILPEGCEIEGLNDSKKMTEKSARRFSLLFSRKPSPAPSRLSTQARSMRRTFSARA